MIDFKTLLTPTPISILGFDKSDLLSSEEVKEGIQDLITALYVYINPMCTGTMRQLWANEQHKIMKRIRNDALKYRHEVQKEFEKKLAGNSSIYTITNNIRIESIYEKEKDK